MTLYASKSHRGFYDDTIHSVLPDDAVEIPSALHSALMKAQATGKIIDWSHKLPVASEPPVTLDTAKQTMTSALIAEIAEIEADQHRATREALNALLQGTSPAEIAATPPGQKLAQLDAQVEQLRARLQKMATATTRDELEAI